MSTPARNSDRERVGTPEIGAPPSALPDPGSNMGAFAGVCRILAFFLLVAGVALSINFTINSGFRKIRTSQPGVFNRLMAGEINADIVISGSSRAVVHFDPRIIQSATGLSAYNIGKNGSQIDLQLAVLKSYLSHNTKPRLIIHSLDPYSFKTSREIYDVAQYIPYLQDQNIYEAVSSIYRDAWKWRMLPLYGYLVEDTRLTWLTGLRACFGYQPKEDHFLGHTPRHTAWTDDFATFKKHSPRGVAFEIETAGIQAVVEIVALCRTNNVPLVFVFSPEYVEMQQMETNRAEIFSKFGEICAQGDVSLWDYSQNPISQRQENFYNSQHLNATGASAFTTDLAQKLVASGLLSRNSTEVQPKR